MLRDPPDTAFCKCDCNHFKDTDSFRYFSLTGVTYWNICSREETETETTPQEEEPKELTLDEWKAQRAGRAKPQYNIRKAGEGEDPSQWKKMFELKKKEREEVSLFNTT